MKRALLPASLALAAAVFASQAGAASGPVGPGAAATGLVLVDQAALRAAPKDAAPLLTPLWRGEALELRGTRGDWLQVWDRQRERGGFVRAGAVFTLAEGKQGLAELAAQLRIVHPQPGAESLGLGLSAALVERASPAWLASAAGAEMLESMVLLHDRLAARVNSAGTAEQARASAHAEVAARHGHPLRAVPRADGTQRLCPHDEPARLLRGHPAASAAQQARAALQLTRPDCLGSDTPAIQWPALHAQRARWLEGIDLQALTPTQRNRLLLRRAGVYASLAFAQRGGDVTTPARQALAAWAQLIPAELSDDDAPALREAAIRLAPLRWVAASTATPLPRLGGTTLTLQAAGPGEHCLVASTAAGHEALRRCSHGLVHTGSARLSPDGRSLVLAVQPLDGWTELWRLDLAADGGIQLQVLPPSAESPGLGATEFAGWAGSQMLVVREADAGGKVLRRFEVYAADLGQPLRWGADPALLGAFQRSADAAWRAGSPLAR